MVKNNNKVNKVAVSFDEMIQADRKKRKAEQLAQQIFGKNRSGSAPAAGNKRHNTQSPAGGSLASRVGVTKTPIQPRASTSGNDRRQTFGNSTTNKPQSGRNQRRQNQLDDLASKAASQSVTRGGAIKASLLQTSASQTRQTDALFNGNEINIRGAAGPYCVVASNFAPGTTAADIESVMAPIGGEMLGCKLISSVPTVIVEMVFVERSGADNVIAMFNNKKADGRVLYVYMKEGGPSHPVSNSVHTRPALQAGLAPSVPSPRPAQESPDDVMEVEQDAVTINDASYTANANLDTDDADVDDGARSRPRGHDVHTRAPREPYRPAPRSDRPVYREDYPRGPRNAEPEVQDGRYGFQEQQYPRRGGGYGGYRDDGRDRFRDGGRMYSDSMMGRGRGGGGGRGRYR